MIPKFRVWDESRKIMGEVGKIDYINRVVYSICNTHNDVCIPFDDSLLMQSTEFKDNCGEDIYVGDIVMLRYNGGEFEYYTVVSSDRDGYRLHNGKHGFLDLDCFSEDCIVRGNVYQDIRLLLESVEE